MSSPKRSRPGLALAVLVLALAIGAGTMALLQSWKPKLGLDLSGGTSITLTARPAAGQGQVTTEQLDEAVNIIRNRVGDIAEAEVTTQGSNHIVVAVPGVNQDEIVKRVGTTAEMRFRQVLAQAAAGQPQVTPTPTTTGTPTPGATETPKQTAKPSATPTDDAGQAGSAAVRGDKPSPSPTPTTSGKKPGAATGDIKVSTTPATAEQQAALAGFECKDYDRSKDDPDKPVMVCDESGGTKYLLGPAIVLGNQIGGATPGMDQYQTQWIVNLELKGQGTKNFAKASAQLVNLHDKTPIDQFAIVLDGKVVSAPVMQAVISDGRSSIEGQFTQQSATDLANVLKYGALPLSFETSSVETVSPTLGSDQLSGGLLAGAIGLALVVLYSFFYYRGLGIVVVLSLAIAAGMTYEAAVLLGKAQGFTLTLAGIAGLIVAVGITADSFVVYFERLRDEVRDGKSLRTAVETGWNRARRTILAADSISLLAAVVLYFLSVGNVRGFAYALGLTTLIDLVIVFLFTKPLMTVLARTKFFGQGHRLSGLNPERLGVTAKQLAPTTATTRTRRPAAATKGA
ncbi:protein translocase subunit SecD [Flindersiella endophytica]